jgi:transposase
MASAAEPCRRCARGRPKQQPGPLPPIWRASDELWALIEPILAESDPPRRGPQRIDQRAALDAILFRLRTGCQGNWLPKACPDDSSVPRASQRWVVERTLGRLSKCRALLIRWDKHACNYLGLLKLACALLWFRRYHRLTSLRWLLRPCRFGTSNRAPRLCGPRRDGCSLQAC